LIYKLYIFHNSSEVIKKREDEFILLSKEYERIENIANIDAIGEHNSMEYLLYIYINL